MARATVTWLGRSTSSGHVLPRGVVLLDPLLRGRISERVAAGLAARGLHVHRIGAAAYVHDDVGELRIITAVLDRRATTPTWVAELDAHHRWLRGRGRPTERQARQLERRGVAWSRARIRDRRGRYLGRPAWWQDDAGSPLPGYLRPTRVVS